MRGGAGSEAYSLTGAPLYFQRYGWMDGWMACDFTSFSMVFQS